MIQTISGTPAANAVASGLKAATGVFAGADFDANYQDAQAGLLGLFTPGVIAGGVCTASGLNVSVPVGTQWLARSWWQIVTAAAVYAVPDNAVTYLWACSDGAIRQTATNAAPTGWSASLNCCLLVKVTLASGTPTVDLTVQQRAAYTGPLRVPTYATDPTAPANGDVWFNTADHKIRVRAGGTTYATAALT